nr:uncharacterized protein LOC127348857 [Lolium perenne]
MPPRASPIPPSRLPGLRRRAPPGSPPSRAFRVPLSRLLDPRRAPPSAPSPSPRGPQPAAGEMAPKRGGKAPVPAKKKTVQVTNPLFEKRPNQFGIVGALPPKKDLHRFVKWPKVVRIQR